MNYFNNLALFIFCFCILSLSSSAQNSNPTLTLETINNFKKKYDSVSDIEPQTIPYKDSYFLRFKELGAIYNPMFPKTRNRVHCENFQKQGKELLYIGYSISTNQATVRLKGRVGTFFGIWKSKYCSSLIEYKVTRTGDELKVKGKIYECFIRA